MDFPVGIDLGTTFSCVAVYRNDRAEIIKCDNERIIPSVVFYDNESLEVSVGEEAEALSARCPKNTIFDIKRIIGRKFDDPKITDITRSNNYPFSVVRGTNGGAQIALEKVSVSKEKSLLIKHPEQVSAEILSRLKLAASNFLSSPITKAVISVPAYFTHAQRSATKKAAQIAGLDVLKLVTEPVAALMHCSLPQLKSGIALVFDFGGGTLDVSIIEIEAKKFKVKAVKGDTALGGRDIDEILVNHFKNQFNETIQKDPRFLRRLRSNCIMLKKKLSDPTKNLHHIQNKYFEHRDQEYCLSMSRAQFDDLNDQIFQAALETAKKCINISRIQKCDIDEVILVGGSCRNLKIQEMLKQYFGESRVKRDVDPDESVALGASIQAALKLGKLDEFEVIEVAPLSLGIAAAGDLMIPAIKSNSALPATGYIHMETVHNDQENVRTEIYEGERKMCKYNNKLGEMTLRGLPKKIAGGVSFKIKFLLNENGILETEIKESTTTKTDRLVLNLESFYLYDCTPRTSLLDDKHTRKEDSKFEYFTTMKNEMHILCRIFLYYIDTVENQNDRKSVEEKCSKFIKETETLDFHKLRRLRKIFQRFTTYMVPVYEIYDIDIPKEVFEVPKIVAERLRGRNCNKIKTSEDPSDASSKTPKKCIK